MYTSFNQCADSTANELSRGATKWQIKIISASRATTAALSSSAGEIRGKPYVNRAGFIAVAMVLSGCGCTSADTAAFAKQPQALNSMVPADRPPSGRLPVLRLRRKLPKTETTPSKLILEMYLKKPHGE